MNIRVIVPILFSDEIVDKVKQEYLAAAQDWMELSFATPSNGTLTLESEFDLALCQPETIREVLRGQEEGADGVVLACTGDPGAAGGKEVSSIPVVGEMEAATHIASLLSYRFSVITVQRQTVPFMYQMTQRIGLSHKLASVRAVEFGVMDLTDDCVPEVVEQCRLAVLEDGAEAIVLGCTGIALGMPEQVSNAIESKLGAYIPIIDPIRAAIGLVQTLALTGYRHSEWTYPKPPSNRPEYRWDGNDHVAVPARGNAHGAT